MPPTETLSQVEKSGKIKVEPGSQVGLGSRGGPSGPGMARGGMVWGPKTQAQDQRGRGRQENMIN